MIEDELLISLVKNEEVLYNKFCSGFKHPENKQVAWKKIARNLEADVQSCMIRWKTLRERYARESKRIEVNSGSDTSVTVEWPLFNEMSFLKQYIKPRTKRGPSKVHDDSSEIATAFLFSEIDELDEDKSPATSPIIVNERKRKFTADAEDEFRSALKSFKEVCQEKKMTTPKTHSEAAMHGFRQLIVATIAGMSEAKQAKAMQRVTEVVMAIKLEPEESMKSRLNDVCSTKAESYSFDPLT